MHNFEHKLLSPKTLKQINLEGKRLYETEDGNRYPSVTTALSFLGQQKIQQWRRNVGFEVANKIASEASRAGTAVHTIAEKYMLNDESWKDGMPIPVSRFQKIKSILDENISTVYGVELRVYSDVLKTAGTVDLVCDWEGKLAVLDFKTSRRHKKKSEITSYFMQAAAYAQCLDELYGMKIETIVVPILVHESSPDVFVEALSDWLPMTKTYFKHYHAGRLR